MLNLENKKKQKENNTKTNILSFGLGVLVVGYLFRLRRGSIWSITLGGLSSFPLTSLDGRLLGLPQELEDLGLSQELRTLGLAALKEEDQNLGVAEYQDHSIRSQAS